MRISETLAISVLLAMVSGCSSPPEPVQPKWNKPGTDINTALPQWAENNVVLKSPSVADRWSVKITFNADAIYPPGIWYAMVHSERIVVNAPDGEGYFRAKAWLRKHGYSGVVSFSSTGNKCLTCCTTEMAFYR